MSLKSRYRHGNAYPVETGQAWSCGKHTFYCGDVTQPGAFHAAVKAAKPDLLYADPPWHDGQMRTFRTISKLAPVDYDWTAILKGVSQLTPTSTPRWVVLGRDSFEAADAMLQGKRRHRWLLSGFNGGVVAYLYYAADRPLPNFPAQLDGKALGPVLEHLPGIILRAYMDSPVRLLPGHGLIVDACAGLGITSRTAQRFGWRSINNEVAPDRVSAALKKMELLTKQKVVRIA